MKQGKLFYGAIGLLALGMTACSSDEPIENGGNQDVKGDKYMAFTITNLNNGTKAIADDPANYEDAAGDEGKITANDLYFLFFDASGNAFLMEGRNTVNGTVENTNMVRPTEVINTENNEYGGGALTGTLVLGKATDPFIGTTPASVLVVANPNTNAMENLGNKSLSAVLDITSTFTGGWATATKFLMTNATYAEQEAVTAVDVRNCIKNTAEEAIANPAIINLERAVAKVRVKYNNNYDVVNLNATSDADKQNFTLRTKANPTGETVQLKAQVYGWRLMNWTSTCYGFKHLSVGDYANWTWGWNDPANHRSYWAYSAASNNEQFANETYDLYAKDQTGNYTQFLNKSWTSGTENVVYCYEHTRAIQQDLKVTTRLNKNATGFNNASVPTAICVKTVIGMEKDGEFTPLNMVKWAGNLYTVEQFNYMVLTTFTQNDDEAAHAGLTVKFVEDVAANNTWKAVVHNNNNNTDTAVPAYSNFYWWKDGITSYWMNIEHFGGLFGVVRNHIYDYEITAVNGLGIPGNNPGTLEEKESYLAAALRILNWRVVSHNVTLE